MAKVTRLVSKRDGLLSVVKVGADIRASQKKAGVFQERQQHKNHKAAQVPELLAVPRYADIVGDDEAGSESDAGKNSEAHGERLCSGLIKSWETWRKELAKWVQAEQADSDTSDNQNELTDATRPPQGHHSQHTLKWLPRTLNLLFTGRKEVEVDVQLQWIQRQTAYTEEARLMELLADEEADDVVVPDDGELKGSGDDFHV